MKPIYIILIIITISLTFSSVRFFVLVQKTKVIIKNTTPFQKTNPGATMRILALGDSTMVGTGAKDNNNSTAGRLSSLYPEASLENISKNGMRITELNEKIKNIENKYDLIVIQIGANDIIRFTSNKTIDSELDKLLTKTKSLSDKVIILHSGDVGETKMFPLFIKPFYSKKSKQVREIYITQTKKHNADYVDLFDTHTKDEFYANDFLHLNDDGYEVWYEKIKEKLD